ncbi:hypothetical protein [Haladaptatus sp. SPP-AMP-3]
MRYKCSRCGSNGIVRDYETWSCESCGYVPPHGAD